MLPMNLLIPSELKLVEVCESRWSLWLVLVPCGHGVVCLPRPQWYRVLLAVWHTGAAGLLRRSVVVFIKCCPL